MQIIRYNKTLGNYLFYISVTSVISVSKNIDKLFLSCIYFYSVRYLYLAFW